ncbi:uncharacterized protein LOC126808959 isoform X3 [Patella vulgata]|uniref:uncharacterized protein LOC126808959 isoform X3 n=1 Tax=Patella vulgata TaxID=6465 RepID=UPI00217FEBF2|nr:uncharacterized protein LOC126808959 isoform X3 [Patella vulgata]
MGPFLEPPFPNLRCSPLGVIPKQEKDTFRLIHDLSFPLGNSVNSGIDPFYTEVHYDSIDTVVSLVKQHGRGALMAKTDIQNAYRLLPIHPDDYELLGFSVEVEGQHYYFADMCLPMGLNMSCQTFERFSTALHWVMETKYNSFISHMIDDFFFIGPPNTSVCADSLQNFMSLTQYLHIPIKASKTVNPTTTITIYGIEIDSIQMVSRLPDEKVIKVRAALSECLDKRKVTLKQLQSLLGLLNFVTLVVVPGRTFLRRLYDLTIGVAKPYYKVRLNNSAKADIRIWHQFMQGFNGRCMFMSDAWLASDYLKLFTDAASSKGYAAVLNSKWFYGTWPPQMQTMSINVQELFPIVLAIEHWGPLLRNHKLLVLSDNECVVFVINKATSKCPHLMKLIRRLILAAIKYNILIRSKHIQGKSNLVADCLSRFKFQQARHWAPWLETNPQILNQDLLKI